MTSVSELKELGQMAAANPPVTTNGLGFEYSARLDVRTPLSPPTTSLRSMELSSSLSDSHDDVETPTPTPMTRSPANSRLQLMPDFIGDVVDSQEPSVNLVRSRTMPRMRSSSVTQRQRQPDEFGLTGLGIMHQGSTLQVEKQTAPGYSRTMRPSASSTIPGIPAFSTPRPEAGDSHQGLENASKRHHLQNHAADFLPGDIAERMQRWVQEIAVCNFDIDRGPMVERRMIGRPWGKGERSNVAFSAFPDTSLFAEGSISYSFKIRHSHKDTSPAELQSFFGAEVEAEEGSYFAHDLADGTETVASPSSAIFSDAETPLAKKPKGRTKAGALPVENDPPPISVTPLTSDRSNNLFGPSTELPETPLMTKLALKKEVAHDYHVWDHEGREWLYGFVWFCQRKDKSIVRGYMQRSIVILTHLPFPSLFLAVLDKAAPMYFDHGYPALEALCYGFAGWPDPVPGKELQLPLLTDLLNVSLPANGEEPQQLVHSLSDKLQKPKLGPTLLVSLPPVQPLRVFSTLIPSLWHLWECMVLGEPLLVIAPDPQTCSTIIWWLRDMVRPIPTDSADLRPYLHIHDMDFSLLVNSSEPQSGVVVGVTNPFFRNAAGHWPNVVSIGNTTTKVKGVPSANHTGEQAQGFLSARKRHVSKDRDFMKRMATVVSSRKLDDPSSNETLRTHFIQLTEKMLAPLSRYVASLVPPVGSPEDIKPFSIDAFLIHLKMMAPNPLQFRSKGLTTKGKVELEFYTRFCNSPGFPGWLRNRITSLTEAKWGQGYHSRIPPSLLYFRSAPSHPTPFDVQRLSGSTRPSEDSSQRSSISAASSWTDTFMGRGRN